MSKLEDLLKGKDTSMIDPMLGFKLSELPGLITDHVLEKIQAPAVNEDAIAEKFLAKAIPYFDQQITKTIQEAETRIALKVAEIAPVLEKTVARLKALEAGGTGGGGGVDIQAIIQGVITALQPDIVRAAQGASQATMEANFKALQAAIYAELDKRTAAATGQPQGTGMVPPAPGGSRLDKILGNDELVGKIIGKILGGETAPLEERLKSYMLGFDHGTKVKVGTMTTDQAFNSVSEIIKGSAGK